MSRRSRGNHTVGRSRAGIVLWTVLVVIFIGAWIALIAVLGGVGGSTDQGASGDRNQADNPSSSEQASGEDDGGAGEGPDDGSVEPRNVSDEVLSERPGGGVPEGEVAIEVEEGRTNGQRGFVSSFVGKAYGYSGKDVEEYHSGYEPYIDPSTYYDSSGGAVLEEYASLVEDGGAENAAVLREYRIVSGEVVGQQVAASDVRGFAPRQLMDSEVPEGATVSEVIYAVGNRYGDASKDEDFGDVYGDVNYLEQRLFLARAEGGGWKILAASSPRPTEDPDAGERPPDAPKVMDPQGPGHEGHNH